MGALREGRPCPFLPTRVWPKRQICACFDEVTVDSHGGVRLLLGTPPLAAKNVNKENQLRHSRTKQVPFQVFYDEFDTLSAQRSGRPLTARDSPGRPFTRSRLPKLSL